MRKNLKEQIDRIMEKEILPVSEMPERAKDHLNPNQILGLFRKVS